MAVEEMQIYLERAEKLFRESKMDDAGIALDPFFKIAETNNLINEFFIDVLAYNYFSPKDEQLLYAILNKKIEFFPKSFTAYETLAFVYYKNSKKECAIQNFKKVMELDACNRNAMKMIRQLQNQ